MGRREEKIRKQGSSCSIVKTHRGKGLKPLVTELLGKLLCNLTVRQLTNPF
jgi:hypothetical protein